MDHRITTGISCPWCQKELELFEEDVKEVLVYHNNVIITTFCCNNRIYIKPVLRMDVKKIG